MFGIQYGNNVYPLHYIDKRIYIYVNLGLRLWQHKFILDKHPCKSTKISEQAGVCCQCWSLQHHHKCIVKKQETLVQVFGRIQFFMRGNVT